MDFMPCNNNCPESKSLANASDIAAQIGAALELESQRFDFMAKKAMQMQDADAQIGEEYAEQESQVAYRQWQANQASHTSTTWREGQQAAAEEVNAILCPPDAATCQRLAKAITTFTDRYVYISQTGRA
jgi:hypothetical protein